MPGEGAFGERPSTLQPNPTTPSPDHQLQSTLTSDIPTPIDSQPQKSQQPLKPPSLEPPTYEPLPSTLVTPSQLRSTILLTSLSTTPNIHRFVPFTSIHGIDDLYEVCTSRWGDYLNHPPHPPQQQQQHHQVQTHQVQIPHQEQQASDRKRQDGQEAPVQAQDKGDMKEGETVGQKQDAEGKPSNKEEKWSRKSATVKRILIEIPWSNVWVEMVRGHRTTCQFDWVEFLRIVRNAWGGVDGREMGKEVGERNVLYVRVRVCVDEVGGGF